MRSASMVRVLLFDAVLLICAFSHACGERRVMQRHVRSQRSRIWKIVDEILLQGWTIARQETIFEARRRRIAWPSFPFSLR